jgi:hypothetical protein
MLPATDRWCELYEGDDHTPEGCDAAEVIDVGEAAMIPAPRRFTIDEVWDDYFENGAREVAEELLDEFLGACILAYGLDDVVARYVEEVSFEFDMPEPPDYPNMTVKEYSVLNDLDSQANLEKERLEVELRQSYEVQRAFALTVAEKIMEYIVRRQEVIVRC